MRVTAPFFVTLFTGLILMSASAEASDRLGQAQFVFSSPVNAQVSANAVAFTTAKGRLVSISCTSAYAGAPPREMDLKVRSSADPQASHEVFSLHQTFHFSDAACLEQLTLVKDGLFTARGIAVEFDVNGFVVRPL